MVMIGTGRDGIEQPALLVLQVTRRRTTFRRS